MSVIKIIGGRPLNGRVDVSGSKNAALPMIAASLLTSSLVNLSNVPVITDTDNMVMLLRLCGTDIRAEAADSNKKVLSIRAATLNVDNIVTPLTGKLRASVLVLGALITRVGYVKLTLPGGCAIGERPIDFHLQALRVMGATIRIYDNFLVAEAEHGLHGAEIRFPNVSVGATENIIMAASLARGSTKLHNMAVEPEVLQLIDMLQKMGADINVYDNGTCVINGVQALHGCQIAVSGDRMEAGTYAMAVAAAGGELELYGIGMQFNHAWIKALADMNVDVSETSDSLIVRRKGELNKIFVTTRPHPYFPSDLQSQIAALALKASGISSILETIYENRLMYVSEFQKMGADIISIDNKVIINGVKSLNGAVTCATDLRAASALIVAALSADGESFIESADYIDRGYHRIEKKLSACGADIARL